MVGFLREANHRILTALFRAIQIYSSIRTANRCITIKHRALNFLFNVTCDMWLSPVSVTDELFKMIIQDDGFY